MKDELLTLQEVAEMFPGKTTRWVRDFFVTPKRVSALRLGRRNTFIDRHSLEDYLKRKTVKAHVRVKLT